MIIIVVTVVKAVKTASKDTKIVEFLLVVK